ncbi:MAG: chromosome partitioning protein ParB [Bacteroidetes bacterium SW_11_45_7]|nr:MAG: chromosome partitioning protein ParB [Bacteroidetes bacterium SW_11_45_7]
MSNKKKEELGKGIRALLEGIDDDLEGQQQNASSIENENSPSLVRNIPLEDIEVNPFQPRADFDERLRSDPALRETLSDAEALHERFVEEGARLLSDKKFQLIAGERRLKAAKMAGQETVPAYLRKADDQEMLEISLIENIQRENLNAMEIAINYQRLIDECELTQDALSNRLGKQRSTVTNYLRLLKLPPDIQVGIKTKQIGMGHARALINVEDADIQLDIFNQIVKKGLSVRKTEELVKKYNEQGAGEKQKTQGNNDKLPPSFQRVQDQLATHFSTRVRVKRKKNQSGEIIINYQSDEDLNRILDILENK